ncbi:MAG TPA: hypothetical protein VH643_20290 [Gemmataceae bacterium]|jgi:hypothetical protein
MSTRITCPGCNRLLMLPDDCTADVLSCPRCLARIPNPQALRSSDAVQAEPPPPSSPAVIQPEAAARGEPGPLVDRDVRRDQRGVKGSVVVLAVLGSLGICYALFGSLVVAQEDRTIQPLLATLGVLALLTAGSAFWVFVRRPSETTGANIGRTLLGVLTLSGVLVGVGFLLAVAGVILLFVVCLSTGGKC